MSVLTKKENMLGLYFHIPFCARKCDYCDFYSLGGGAEWMEPYLNVLCQDVERTAGPASDYLTDTVYFGGGTPTWFGGSRIVRILDTVRKNFTLSDECEITVEGNPDSITPELLEALRGAGVNRLSLGVQSANDRELKNIGRLHSTARARESVMQARAAGFDNLSLDLIYGLPGQSMKDWQTSVETLMTWSPDHISCYGLKLEEGTPLWQRRERESFPDDDLQADMYLWLTDHLIREGYIQYEISNFARPGKESRHNLKYWQGGAYLGFGPGAHSDFGGRRYGIARDLNEYLKGVPEGRYVLSEEEWPDDKERAGEYLMLRLRTAEGISRGEYRHRFGLPFSPLESELEKWRSCGWTDKSGERWRFTPEGWLRSNILIGQLLQQQEDNIM